MIVDVHHHWMPKEHYLNAARYLEDESVEPYSFPTGEKAIRIYRHGMAIFSPTERMCRLDEQIRDMDDAGIDVAVLSTGCWQDWNSLDICRFINDELARCVQEYPERLIGLAHVPVVAEAVDEMDRAIKDLGFRGICLTTHFRGRYPDDEAYRPFYRKLERLGMPVVIHAASVPAEYENLKRHHQAFLGRILDTGLSLARLLFGGIIDEYPSLRVIVPHLGGAFLMLERDAYLNLNEKDRENFVEIQGHRVSHELLKRIFFDTAPASRGSALVKCAVDILGIEQLLYGSDYPVLYDWMKRSKQTIDELNLAAEDLRGIMGENAAELFRL